MHNRHNIKGHSYTYFARFSYAKSATAARVVTVPGAGILAH